MSPEYEPSECGILSEYSSRYTSAASFSSGTTIPGPGFLTGRALKYCGDLALRAVDNILVRKKLADVCGRFPQKMTNYVSNQDRAMYADLLELSRPAFPLRLLIYTTDLSYLSGQVYIHPMFDNKPCRLSCVRSLCEISNR